MGDIWGAGAPAGGEHCPTVPSNMPERNALEAAYGLCDNATTCAGFTYYGGHTPHICFRTDISNQPHNDKSTAVCFEKRSTTQNYELKEAADDDLVLEHNQCGGMGWKGPTKCASGLECKFQDKFYYVCEATQHPTHAPTTAPTVAVSRLKENEHCGKVDSAACGAGCSCQASGHGNKRCIRQVVTVGKVGIGDKCGGEGWAGLTTCDDGLDCVGDRVHKQCARVEHGC